MRVDINDPGWRGPLADVQEEEPAASSPAETQVPRDRLEFSTNSRRLQTDDGGDAARAERIARIRQAVAEGTYNIRAETLAEALIQGAVLDELA